MLFVVGIQTSYPAQILPYHVSYVIATLMTKHAFIVRKAFAIKGLRRFRIRAFNGNPKRPNATRFRQQSISLRS